MTSISIARTDALLVLRAEHGGWHVERQLEGRPRRRPCAGMKKRQR